jgi:hypothetical protein
VASLLGELTRLGTFWNQDQPLEHGPEGHFGL